MVFSLKIEITEVDDKTISLKIDGTIPIRIISLITGALAARGVSAVSSGSSSGSSAPTAPETPKTQPPPGQPA
jgi:hypothetical protein